MAIPRVLTEDVNLVLLEDGSGHVLIDYVAVIATIVVQPENAKLKNGDVQSYTATAYDQYGIALISQPVFTWTNTGGGSLSGSTLTANGTSGFVTARSGLVHGSGLINAKSGSIGVDMGFGSGIGLGLG